MFCRVCGKEINDQAVICVHCGCSTQNQPTPDPDADAYDTGVAIVSGFIPLVGLVIWALNKNTKPLRAKSASKGALVGLVISLTLYAVAVLITIAAEA